MPKDISHLKKFSYTETLELKFKGNILWLKGKARCVKTVAEVLLCLKWKLKKFFQ